MAAKLKVAPSTCVLSLRSMTLRSVDNLMRRLTELDGMAQLRVLDLRALNDRIVDDQRVPLPQLEALPSLAQFASLRTLLLDHNQLLSLPDLSPLVSLTKLRSV